MHDLGEQIENKMVRGDILYKKYMQGRKDLCMYMEEYCIKYSKVYLKLKPQPFLLLFKRPFFLFSARSEPLCITNVLPQFQVVLVVRTKVFHLLLLQM